MSGPLPAQSYESVKGKSRKHTAVAVRRLRFDSDASYGIVGSDHQFFIMAHRLLFSAAAGLVFAGFYHSLFWPPHAVAVAAAFAETYMAVFRAPSDAQLSRHEREQVFVFGQFG